MTYALTLNLFIVAVFIILYHHPKIRETRERNIAEYKARKEKQDDTHNQSGEEK